MTIVWIEPKTKTNDRRNVDLFQEIRSKHTNSSILKFLKLIFNFFSFSISIRGLFSFLQLTFMLLSNAKFSKSSNLSWPLYKQLVFNWHVKTVCNFNTINESGCPSVFECGCGPMSISYHSSQSGHPFRCVTFWTKCEKE